MVQCPAKEDACPPWFIPDNNSITGCSCGTHKQGDNIKCGSDFTLLRFGYCMTYNSTDGTTVYGKCPYIAHYTIKDYVYIQLPENVSQLNEFMCGPLNREDTLCGSCKPGYGTAFYSYNLECQRCWDHGYGWILYYAIELFPITVLYLIVVIFHIRATCSALSSLVFLSQVVVYTVRLHVPLHMYIENNITGFPYTVINMVLIMCGTWSLDFFRSVIPPFCVGNIRNIHGLALEYTVAFYPICLMVITCTCIKLHNNNFRPVVWLWKPFHKYVVHMRRGCTDARASIINGFATFLLLSYSKILFVSFTLLDTVHINNLFSSSAKCVLYYDPTVDCYSTEHFIFLTLAVSVCAIFVVFPVAILILYPTRLCRRCIMNCGTRRWNALRTIMETFQGEYKDGTNGTWDFRMFSASFLILRFLDVIFYLGDHYYSQGPLLFVQGLVLVLMSCVITIARPYKEMYRNIIDSVALALLGTILLEFFNVLYFPGNGYYFFTVAVTVVGAPHMVLLTYICYRLAEKAGLNQWIRKKYSDLKRFARSAHQVEADTCTEGGADANSFPHRLVYPGEYEHNTQGHTTSVSDPIQTTGELNSLVPAYTYGSIN